jgi:radical SAM superfamily enzyme YgiQ (UPF0313 family)
VAIYLGPQAGEARELDVLLIYPKHPMPHWAIVPHGCLSLAAWADQHGFSAGVWDTYLDPRCTDEALLALLVGTRVRYAGLSLFSTQLGDARRLARLVREVSPATRIIVGGQHVAATSTDTFPEGDLLVSGEGERALLEILQGRHDGPSAARGGGSLPLAASGRDPRLVHGEIVDDINEIPLPTAEIWRTYAGFQRLTRLGLIMARGCPFDCTFCHFEERSRSARQYSPDRLGAYVQMCHEQTGLGDVFFLDDIFTLNRKWALEVCDELKARDMDHLRYTCFSHVRVGSPDLYRKMGETGFRQIQLGVESGEEHVRRRMHKNFTDEQIRTTVRVIQDAGMEPHCLFILGYAGETVETMRATIRLAESLDTTCWFSLAQPLPGTQFLHEARAEGTILEHDLAKYGNAQVVYLPAGVSLEQMVAIRDEAEHVRIQAHKKFARARAAVPAGATA